VLFVDDESLVRGMLRRLFERGVLDAVRLAVLRPEG
jgi:hypothetical protein